VTFWQSGVKQRVRGRSGMRIALCAAKAGTYNGSRSDGLKR